MAIPLIERVADGLPHETFWKVEALYFFKVTTDESQARAAMTGSNGVAQGGTGLRFTKVFFNSVEVGDELDDSGGSRFSGVECFGKASSDVGHAAAQFDVFGVIALVAGVDAVAVALKNSFPVFGMFTEGLVEVFSAAAILPTVADASTGARIIEHPDVAGAGFSGAGGELFHWRFVELEVAARKTFEVDRFGDGAEEFEALEGPVIQGVARGVESETLEDALLTVDWEVIGVF